MATELESDLKLEIAHVLTIDLVAYSTLLIQEQSRVVAELNRIVRNTPCFRAAEAAEKLTRLPTGDGMALVFFGDPEAPLECAMQITTELKNRPEIRVRMGIHSGPISQVLDVNDHSNVAGAGIDMAQRVMDCGDAGHILVSKRVADDLAAYSRWNRHLHDLGECEIKHGRRVTIFNFYNDSLGNSATPTRFRSTEPSKDTESVSGKRGRFFRLAKPVGIAALVLAVVALIVSSRVLQRRSPISASDGSTGGAIPEKSVAVLPFENRSEEKANAYFADGIQDEILTRLAKISDLTVISRTSTQHYKSAPQNLPEIARQLGVAYVVEGSVQKSGETVRINVQLIRAATDSHLWADTFDRKLIDIFVVESEVAKAIADQLQARLSATEEQLIAARSTEKPEAYDEYLRGLAYSLRTAITPANTRGAQQHLREAVRLDPKFALSWALLSYVDSLSYLSVGFQPTPALQEEAQQAAEIALALQPHLGEALHAMGFYRYACLKDYESAEGYFEQARHFLHNDSIIPASLAYVARRRGQWDKSESYFDVAERVDPRNVKLLTQHALSYLKLRSFEKASQKLDQVLEITPGDADTLALKATVAQAQGDLAQAAALLAPLNPMPDDFVALEKQTYQAILERRPAQMVTRLQELLPKSDPALGFINGELRFWLGWAQKVAGDDKGAQESWRMARQVLESFVEEQPQNYIIIGDLALINAGLDDRAAAIRLAEQAAGIIPIQTDAVAGPIPLEILTRVAALTGDADGAIAGAEKLLSIPCAGALAGGAPLTPALLRLDPMFDLVRHDPRFQALTSSPGKK